MNEPGSKRAREQEGPNILKGVVLCGLALSAGASTGAMPFALRAATAVLAGRALGAGVSAAEAAGRPSVRPWMMRVGLVWLATFSPFPLVASPEVVRSWAVVAAFALLLRGLSGASTLALASVALVASFVADGAPPHPGLLGELEYALGATWPRGWSDVGWFAGLFLTGGAWARTGGTASVAAPEIAGRTLRWLAPLGSLGRMPITALLVHALLTSAFAAEAWPAWNAPVALAALLVEMAVAHRWLRTRERGPAEQALQMIRAAGAAGASRLRRALGRKTAPDPTITSSRTTRPDSLVVAA